jgi:hypothetical protein
MQGLRTTSKQMQRAQAALKSPRASQSNRTPPLSPRSPSVNDHRLAAAAAALLAASNSNQHRPGTARRVSGADAGADSAAGDVTTNAEDDADDARVRELLAQADRLVNWGPRHRGAQSRLEATLAQAAAVESDVEDNEEKAAELLELLSCGTVKGGKGKWGKVSSLFVCG